jgi:UDP-N-acetylenolpyruvoylglucosamine reductase
MNALIERMASEAELKYTPDQADAVERLARIAAAFCIDQCGGKGVCVGSALVKHKIHKAFEMNKPV